MQIKWKILKFQIFFTKANKLKFLKSETQMTTKLMLQKGFLAILMPVQIYFDILLILGLNSIKMLNLVNNKFILNILKYFIDDGKLVTITEYCEQGDLQTLTEHHMGYKIQECIVWSMILQFAYALLEFNEIGLHHRQLIPENILLQCRLDNYVIKINDFRKSSKETICQAPTQATYLPPEFYSDGIYNQKSHIWQLGHIIYYLVNQKLIFQKLETFWFIKEQFKKGAIFIIISSIQIPDNYSKNLKQFVNDCLTIDHKQRPNIIQILKMPGNILLFSLITAIREAIQKKYFRFNMEQLRHLYHWINGKEEQISKPQEYLQNEIILEDYKPQPMQTETPRQSRKVKQFFPNTVKSEEKSREHYFLRSFNINKLTSQSLQTQGLLQRRIMTKQTEETERNYKKPLSLFQSPNWHRLNTVSEPGSCLITQKQHLGDKQFESTKIFHNQQFLTQVSFRDASQREELVTQLKRLAKEKEQFLIKYLGLKDYYLLKEILQQNPNKENKVASYISLKLPIQKVNDIKQHLIDVIQIEKKIIFN